MGAGFFGEEGFIITHGTATFSIHKACEGDNNTHTTGIFFFASRGLGSANVGCES